MFKLKFATPRMLLTCASALRTAATTSLTGVVTDAQGAAVLEAYVIVTELAKSISFGATTNREGRFVVAQVPASSYSIRVEHVGFATAQIPRLAFNVNDALSLRVP